MDEQIIVSRAIDKYQRLDEVLRSQMLKGEDVAFLQGRKFELMPLIYTLDEQAIVRLTESLVAKPEMADLSRFRDIHLN